MGVVGRVDFSSSRLLPDMMLATLNVFDGTTVPVYCPPVDPGVTTSYLPRNVLTFGSPRSRLALAYYEQGYADMTQGVDVPRGEQLNLYRSTGD